MVQQPTQPGTGTGTRPAPPARRSPLPLVVAAVAGTVLGALIVGSIWLLSGDSGPEVSGSTPDRVGNYVRFADAEPMQGQSKQAVQRVQAWDQGSAERLSATYQGAEAAVQTYASDRLDEQFTLLVVRARVPFPPFVPYRDPVHLQLKRPPEELREFGDVACVVRNDPIPEGGEDRPEATHVVSCLRTSANATVEIRDIGGDLQNDPQKVADLVNDAWANLN